MKLVRLIYWSRAKEEIRLPLVESIRQKAVRHNTEHHLTGFLTFGGNWFLQALEGESEAINRLYNRISRDPRHEQVTLISYQEVPERAFSQWAMGIVALHDVSESLCLRVAPTPEFRPHDLGAEGALRLLQTVAGTLEKIRRKAAA